MIALGLVAAAVVALVLSGCAVAWLWLGDADRVFRAAFAVTVVAVLVVILTWGLVLSPPVSATP